MSASTSSLPRFITTSDASKALSVSRDKVTDLIRVGELRAVNVALHRGGKARWRIALSDLESFIASRTTSPTPKPVRRKRSNYTPRYYQ